MPTAAGTIRLTADGKRKLSPDGKVRLHDGVTDCCCGPTVDPCTGADCTLGFVAEDAGGPPPDWRVQCVARLRSICGTIMMVAADGPITVTATLINPGAVCVSTLRFKVNGSAATWNTAGSTDLMLNPFGATVTDSIDVLTGDVLDIDWQGCAGGPLRYIIFNDESGSAPGGVCCHCFPESMIDSAVVVSPASPDMTSCGYFTNPALPLADGTMTDARSGDECIHYDSGDARDAADAAFRDELYIDCGTAEYVFRRLGGSGPVVFWEGRRDVGGGWKGTYTRTGGCDPSGSVAVS